MDNVARSNQAIPVATETASFKIGLDLSALDPTFKEHHLRGIGRYVRELKSYLDKHFSSTVQIDPFDHTWFRKETPLDKITDHLPVGRHTVKQQFVYPLRLLQRTRKKFDLLHFPAHMDAPSWSVRKYMITVLDLIPFVCADLYKPDVPGWRFELARWLEVKAMQNADFLLAISENTKENLVRLLNIPAERIIVTPLGVDAKFRNATPPENETAFREKWNIPQNRPIVLYVGGIDQRKNWKGLLKSFRKLIDRFQERGEELPVLVMSGRTHLDRQYPKMLCLKKELELDDHVALAGFVPDDELLQLFQIAGVFFFPSLYEGFGLPPLEAMAAGCPVVSTGTSSVSEVLGDAALVVNPEDPDQCAEALETVLKNDNLREELKIKGPEQSKLFSWDRTGELTLNAYEQMAREYA